MPPIIDFGDGIMPPIYDNNGTTSYQIAKIYDHNGTTSTQIGKVYDHNGTTSSLIYTAETLLYENGTSNTSLIGGWDNRSTGGGSITFQSTYMQFSYYNDPNLNLWSHGIVYTKNKINCAGYTKLCLNMTNLSGNCEAYLILRNDIVNSDNPWYGAVVASSAKTAAGILTLDLTSYQSSYYIAVDGRPNGSWYYNGSHRVDKVWLE